MEIELRRTAPDDPAVLRLAGALRDEVEERGADNAAERPRKQLAEAVMADIETLVAYAGDLPVGTGALRPYGENVVEVKRMYVIPSHRGAGVATRLLDGLGERARAHCCAAIRLDTHDAAIRGRTAGSRSVSSVRGHNARSRAFHSARPPRLASAPVRGWPLATDLVAGPLVLRLNAPCAGEHVVELGLGDHNGS
jgi:GNAT superfamily N-acetyltransferase